MTDRLAALVAILALVGWALGTASCQPGPTAAPTVERPLGRSWSDADRRVR